MNEHEIAAVLAVHFPNVVGEPNGAVRARCESTRCDWYVMRDTPRVHRNWRVVIRLHSAHVAAVLAALPPAVPTIPGRCCQYPNVSGCKECRR